ncbi:GtrA family protein [Sedimentitalea sp.]|uniref:GtrA family protein n=1 Tax=Sedimentitalea sp. TaxID=2048915 RepID=UPI00329799D2
MLRYAAFALLATIANLATQRLVLAGGSTTSWFIAAIGIGTIIGLVVKYALDKRWIFDDRSTGVKAHGKKFSLYTAMGIITTGVFWATETVFWLVWQTSQMRELGAVLGLAVGYVVKYNLDRRFVFAEAKLEPSI